jgi:cytochrome d ubiquinol oxidase subunit II
MKTKGELQEKLKKWVYPAIIFFIIMYLMTTLVTFTYSPYMVDRMKENSWFLIIPALTILAIAFIPREIKLGNEGKAFIFSCVSIVLLICLFAVGTFPVMLRSTISPEYSLTFMDSSSQLTLTVLFIIALIGVPLVMAYGYYIYRIFRGKVELSEHSY